ncbi:hypothetical protein F5883DRAFT_68051 [Diaporthe sp. PMI_573]|nr:hypothetical protein F5883DRAFT_68051 [Diaporthaceae sp. PMI_573]
MACHQAHNIPWATAASHLKCSRHIRTHNDRTNLTPRYRDNQGKELTYFVNAFVKNLKQHADDEMKKYPASVEPLDPNTTIISDRAFKRLSLSLPHITKDIGTWLVNADDEGLPHKLPERYRRMACYFDSNGDGDKWATGHEMAVSIELFKLLILHGEMETLQNICTHPHAAWEEVWHKHRDSYGDQNSCGWSFVPELALKAYVGLNLLLSLPELWDEKSRRREGNEVVDYRDTACYQRMLCNCTVDSLGTNIAALPHRQFFGVAEGQFSDYAWPRHKNGPGKHAWMLDAKHETGYPYGMLPLKDFLELETELIYAPSALDVGRVRWCLCHLSLPTELANEILGMAGYQPMRRLEREHDPLHADNRDELHRYLDFCWKVMVRCEVMGRWLDEGHSIPWDCMLNETIIGLVTGGDRGLVKGGKKFYEKTYRLTQESPFQTMCWYDYKFV